MEFPDEAPKILLDAGSSGNYDLLPQFHNYLFNFTTEWNEKPHSYLTYLFYFFIGLIEAGHRPQPEIINRVLLDLREYGNYCHFYQLVATVAARFGDVEWLSALPIPVILDCSDDCRHRNRKDVIPCAKEKLTEIVRIVRHTLLVNGYEEQSRYYEELVRLHRGAN